MQHWIKGLAASGCFALAAGFGLPAYAQQDPCAELTGYVDPNRDGVWTAPPSNAAALDAANRCFATRGANSEIYGRRAYIHRLMGNYGLADADATQRIAIDSSPGAYRSRGIIRQAAGRHDEAIADLREALRRNYDRPAWARVEISRSLRQLERYSEALAEADAAAALDPRYADALFERGLIFDAQERWDEAVGAWTRYIAANASNSQAFEYRSKAFSYLERWPQALDDADRAIALNPRAASSFNNRGFALHNLGRYEESITAFRRATQLEPDNASAWDNLCGYLTDAGEPSAALVACDRRESLAGVTARDRARISSFRGLAYEALGDTAQAIAAYRIALASPDAHTRTRERAEAGLLRLGQRV